MSTPVFWRAGGCGPWLDIFNRHDVQQLITCILSRGPGGFKGKPTAHSLARVMGWQVSRVYECVILSQGVILETPNGLALSTKNA